MTKEQAIKKIDETYEKLIKALIENKERYIKEIIEIGGTGLSGIVCLDEDVIDENVLKIDCKFELYPTFPIKIKFDKEEKNNDKRRKTTKV